MSVGEKLGGVVGTVIGTVIGGPFGAAAGPAVGSAIGGAIEDALDGEQVAETSPAPAQPAAPAPKPMVASKLCWLGFVTAVVPAGLQWGLGIDWTAYTNPTVDAIIIGALTMGLRLFTNGAIGPKSS